MSGQCGYCQAKRDDVVAVIVACPEHGALRTSAACPECMADPTRSGAVHVHQVAFMGQGCEQRVVLRPTGPASPRVWCEGGWRVEVQQGRSDKRFGYAIHGADGSLYVSDHVFGSPETALAAGVADARSCATFEEPTP